MIISNTAVISDCYNYWIHIGILYVPPTPGNFFTELPAFLFFFFKLTIHFMKGINVLVCVGCDDKLAQTRRLTDNRHIFLHSAGRCDLTGLASSYQDTSITMGIPFSGPNPTLKDPTPSYHPIRVQGSHGWTLGRNWNIQSTRGRHSSWPKLQRSESTQRYIINKVRRQEEKIQTAPFTNPHLQLKIMMLYGKKPFASTHDFSCKLVTCIPLEITSCGFCTTVSVDYLGAWTG